MSGGSLEDVLHGTNKYQSLPLTSYQLVSIALDVARGLVFIHGSDTGTTTTNTSSGSSGGNAHDSKDDTSMKAIEMVDRQQRIMIHFDVKPANILLTANRGNAKICDFGLQMRRFRLPILPLRPTRMLHAVLCVTWYDLLLRSCFRRWTVCDIFSCTDVGRVTHRHLNSAPVPVKPSPKRSIYIRLVSL